MFVRRTVDVVLVAIWLFHLCSVTFADQELSEVEVVPNVDDVDDNDTLTTIEQINLEHQSPTERIVNGELVPNGTRLFQVALFRKGRFVCGGSLVSRRFVLTAAHCVERAAAKTLEIRYGSQQYKVGPMIAIQSVHKHPEYDPETVQNDIALLRLALPVPKVRSKVSYAVINSKLDPEVNITVVVSGWGRTARNQTVSEQLLMTNLQTVSRDYCQQRWQSIFTIGHGMICANDNSSSACHGDSGGPLTLQDEDQTLIGVVSLGSPNCYSIQRPNVYTNVFHYRDWIADVMKVDQVFLK